MERWRVELTSAPMIIRDETPADRAGVHAVVQAAFDRSDEAALVDRLREDGDSVISLVAEDSGRIVGHVLLSRMSAPFPALGLAPVSVTPARQGTGVGSALIRQAVGRARALGRAAIFCLGDPVYYARFDFNVEAARGFTSPYAGDHFMVLALTARLPTDRGRVDYAPAFADLS